MDAKRPDGTGSAHNLATYRDKRDFGLTPEPAGQAAEATAEPTEAAPGPAARRFVVQRHRARRTHYDLRFEIDGVLVSWAVPRGPTLDPKTRRAAIHVEDHPLEYLDFEGVIPAGQYGGGDVIVWDIGTWEPHGTDDPAAAVAAGELHAEMYGSKLRGRLVLIRTGRDAEHPDRDWLVLHKKDDFAVPGWNPDDHPASALTGRTNEQVKADPERMWRGDQPPADAAVALPRKSGPPSQPDTEAPPRIEGPSEPALAALDALGAAGTWEVFGRELRLTNLDKELFDGRDGGPPVTKREFIRYTARIAPTVLPYLAGRVLNMHRFPGGAATNGFWHKRLPEHAPDWLTRWDDPDVAEPTRYLLVEEAAALIWAANFGALEWHAWTSRASNTHEPTYALIDIDPGPATSWDEVLTLTRLHRTALDHLGVRAAAKLTGRRGIQIWIPIAAGYGFDDTRAWVEGLSRAVGAVVPELVSWRWEISDRGGRARLDYTQNVIHKTLVAPYSPRAAAGAPVSAPIEWTELDNPPAAELRPDGVDVRTIFDRLAERGDPFAPLLTIHQALPPLG
jgi:bifunctional non-homologous end joining protein LigD